MKKFFRFLSIVVLILVLLYVFCTYTGILTQQEARNILMKTAGGFGTVFGAIGKAGKAVVNWIGSFKGKFAR